MIRIILSIIIIIQSIPIVFIVILLLIISNLNISFNSLYFLIITLFSLMILNSKDFLFKLIHLLF
jgi:hypothetical protein